MDTSIASLEWQENWLLTEAEKQALLIGRTAASQLGISAMLKYFQNEGRFPEKMSDLSAKALWYLKKTLNIQVSLSAVYKLSTRSYERFQHEIRIFLGIEASSSHDNARALQWLCGEDIGLSDQETLLPKLQAWYREQRLELPRIAQQRKIIKNALRTHEQVFLGTLYSRLTLNCCTRLDEMLAGSSGEEDFRASILTQLRSDPARSSLKTVLRELDKLNIINALVMPPELFQGIPDKIIHKYRMRAGTESITELRQHGGCAQYM